MVLLRPGTPRNSRCRSGSLRPQGHPCVSRAARSEEIDDNAPVKEVVTEPKEFTDFAYKRFVKEMVFKNPIVWILATSNFFIYIIRFTILDWGATFLTQDRGTSIQTASTVVGITEVLGIVGTLLAGWATDKFFGSKAHRTCLIGLASATACFILFWLTPMRWAVFQWPRSSWPASSSICLVPL